MSERLRFPDGAFGREDDGDDYAFYFEPRLVTHIDEGAIAALTHFYREHLPEGGVVADLMSSWVSHYPDDVTFAEVIGHGMNGQELAANPRLSRWFMHDLNREPALPFGDQELDAATICVSVQYLQKPIEVLSDIRRTLKPGGPLIISFSNRCFPTKAVALWRGLHPADHARLVELYLHEAGFTDISTHVLMVGNMSDPMTAVVGRAP